MTTERPDERLIAVFVDYENLAIGVRRMRKGSFPIDLVLRRLLEKGRIVYKRAYCDWGNYRDAVREFHTQGVELIDIPQSKASGKNSADIHMVVDALDLCNQKNHIDSFALISGDSDFSPLVAKLKENQKWVIGCGVKSSTSDLLIGSCDEFIYYDDLIREVEQKIEQKKQKPTVARKKSASDPEARKRTSARSCWRRCDRSSATTTPSGARCSSRRSAGSIRASTRATTARARSPRFSRWARRWA